MAALAAAKAGFTTGELEDAKKNLQWAIDKAREEEMRDVARLRLAGILLDEKKYDEALKLLVGEDGGRVRRALRRSARATSSRRRARPPKRARPTSSRSTRASRAAATGALIE